MKSIFPRIVGALLCPFRYFGRPTWTEFIIAVCAVVALWQIILLRETNQT